MRKEELAELLDPQRLVLAANQRAALAAYAQDADNKHIPLTFFLICQSLAKNLGAHRVSGDITKDICDLLAVHGISPIGGWNPLGQFNRAWSKKYKHFRHEYTDVLDRERTKSGDERSPWKPFVLPEYRAVLMEYFRHGASDSTPTSSETSEQTPTATQGIGDSGLVAEKDVFESELNALYLDALSKEISTSGQIVLDLEDARNHIQRAIVLRRGQKDFRDALIHAYEGKCAITGCDAIAALEAAHVYPYRGMHTNWVKNGLLLRSDIHVLFDLHLIGIEPASKSIHISAELQDTSYRELRGRRVRAPRKDNSSPDSFEPDPELLLWRWERFQRVCGGRR